MQSTPHPKRRRFRRLARFALAWLIIVGPWPAREPTPIRFSTRSAQSDHLWLSPGKSSASEFRVGVGLVDLTTDTPVPLAGFIGQIAQPYEEVNSPCAARALTIVNQTASVTVLAVDLLLINDNLGRAVLSRTGLPRDQIYFTATHTHGCPGGWANHPLERLVAGTYDPDVFNQLADRLAEVVMVSRRKLVPAELAFVQLDARGLQRNRIAPGELTNDRLSAWVFRSRDSESQSNVLATLASFGAHATISHPIPPQLDGDYPAAFAATLPKLVAAGTVLFAAGTVGDASPIRPPAATHRLSTAAYGRQLASALAVAIDRAKFTSTIDLANLGSDVVLPSVQIPFGVAGLRFSPIASMWVGRRTAYLHVVQLGPAVLVGFPGDYAGHLIERLRSPVPVVATSFNGDYVGYLVSKQTFFGHPSYETRWMSFYGPNLGDQLTDLARWQIKKLSFAQTPGL